MLRAGQSPELAGEYKDAELQVPARIYCHSKSNRPEKFFRTTHHFPSRYKILISSLQREQLPDYHAKNQHVQKKANGEYQEAYPPPRMPLSSN